MSDIDWSEAPEATHYDSRPYVIHTFMRKTQDGCEWEFLTKDGEWRLYGPMSALDVAVMTARPSAWTGEGLPPVGTACEFRRTMPGAPWKSATILCVGEKRVFFRDKDGDELSRSHGEVEFRPVRTPEQIVADKRADEVRRILDAMPHDVISGHTGAIVEWMLADGYQKFEIVDE